MIAPTTEPLSFVIVTESSSVHFNYHHRPAFGAEATVVAVLIVVGFLTISWLIFKCHKCQGRWYFWPLHRRQSTRSTPMLI